MACPSLVACEGREGGKEGGRAGCEIICKEDRKVKRAYIAEVGRDTSKKALHKSQNMNQPLPPSHPSPFHTS
jgi:hypothetical protein